MGIVAVVGELAIASASFDFDLFIYRERGAAPSSTPYSTSGLDGMVIGADLGTGTDGNSADPTELVDPRRPRVRNALTKN